MDLGRKNGTNKFYLAQPGLQDPKWFDHAIDHAIGQPSNVMAIT